MHAKYIVDTVWGNSFNTGLFVNVFKIDLFVHWTFRFARQLEISDKALMCPVGFNILYMHQLYVAACLCTLLLSPLVLLRYRD